MKLTKKEKERVWGICNYFQIVTMEKLATHIKALDAMFEPLSPQAQQWLKECQEEYDELMTIKAKMRADDE